MSNDIDRENQASSPVNITGGDEAHKADVFQDPLGNKRLRVQSDTVITDGGVTISSALRIIEDGTDRNISNGSYTNIYALNAAAVCSGFMVSTDTDKFGVRLTIDGNVIFDIDTRILKDVSDIDKHFNTSSYIYYNNNTKGFYFFPAFPMKVDTSISIDVRSYGGNKKVEVSYVQVAQL